MMIQNLLLTRNLRLMNFHVSSHTNRTGNGMTLSLTTNNVMAKPSNLLSAESNAISLMNVHVLPAMLLNPTLPGMMVRKNPRFVVRYVLTFTHHLTITGSPKHISFAALIVHIYLNLLKIVNTLSSTSVRTLSALTTFITLKS
jgi:hypothetical protein